MNKKLKKYGTTSLMFSGEVTVFATSKKEAAEIFGISILKVYIVK